MSCCAGNAGRDEQKPFLPAAGSASYLLYLFHPVVMQGSVKVIEKIPALHHLGLGFATIAALAAALAASIVIHLTIEKTAILSLGTTVVKSLRA